jgi:hypothetical protein
VHFLINKSILLIYGCQELSHITHTSHASFKDGNPLTIISFDIVNKRLSYGAMRLFNMKLKVRSKT